MIRIIVSKHPREVVLDIYDGDRLVRARAVVVPDDQGTGSVGNLTALEFAELVGRGIIEQAGGQS